MNQTNLKVNLYSKKYLKAEKKWTQKEASMFICTNNIDWFNI